MNVQLAPHIPGFHIRRVTQPRQKRYFRTYGGGGPTSTTQAFSAEWARRSASQPSLLKGQMYTDEVLMCLFGLILLAPHLGHNGMYYRAETNFSVREYKKGIRKNWDIFQN